MAWHTTSRHARGYGADWVKLRQRVLARDKHLCQGCRAAGRISPATHVDHIVPKARGGSNDQGNLQSLCRSCHDAKTAEENGRTVKLKLAIGTDGWPV